MIVIIIFINSYSNAPLISSAIVPASTIPRPKCNVILMLDQRHRWLYNIKITLGFIYNTGYKNFLVNDKLISYHAVVSRSHDDHNSLNRTTRVRCEFEFLC